MRKSSSDSSSGGRPGARNSSSTGRPSFKKEESGKPFGKSSRPAKKNYDGRDPSAGSSGAAAGGGARSKPYSGRVSDGDSKRSFDKPSFKRDDKDSDRKPRREFDKPFSDRPKKSFDKPGFKKDDRDSGSERKPRREFDKPFSDRPKKSFDKPFFKKDDRDNGGGERKPRGEYDKPFSDRPRKSFDKPGFKKDDRDSGGGERKPRREFDKPFSDRPRKSFDKPDFKKDDRGGDGERKPRREFDKPFSDRPKKSYDKPAYKKDDRDSGAGERPPRREFDKPFSDRPKKIYDKPAYKKEETTGEGEESAPGSDFKKSGKSADSRPFRERPKSAFGKTTFDKKGKKGKEEKGPRTFTDIVNNVFNQPPKSQDPNAEDHPGKREQFEDKVYGELEEANEEDRPKKPFELKKNTGKKKHIHDHSEGRKKKYKDEEDELDEDDKEINQKDGPRLEMPLNKFIAHSGECSRRDAAELVRQGKVKVNEELVLDPGYRVQHDDKVTMSGKKLTPQKGMVYILLNKPKGFITTNDDPQGRKTVMQLVGNSGVDRLFPVGRLDKETSGLLLITNDGDLTQKLCHPAYNIKKVYQVTLDKALTKADFEKIIEGVELEDGQAVVDAISYLEKKNELGLEIHSGRNRIVRRIFESLGYVVEKLDRVMYAGLTKKNLPRSKWRYLDEREVVLLKHFKN